MIQKKARMDPKCLECDNKEDEVFCSGGEEDDKRASFAIDNCHQGVEQPIDSQTAYASASGSLGQCTANEDRRLLGSRKNCTDCLDQDDKSIDSNKLSDSDEMHEAPVQTLAQDDADESDVEEEDVKVCDICGDAGREDLLAVCSRCSDGAEHTYCMREMLDKVPEGDWLCEECKFNEEEEAQKQEQSRMIGTNERTKFLGRASSVSCDPSFKSDNKELFGERGKVKNVSLNKQVPSKRSGDSIEAGLTAKRQALESSLGVPTASSPSWVPVLSKDNSFKNLDKIKVKPTNQIPASTADSSEDGCSPSTSAVHAPKGNISVTAHNNGLTMQQVPPVGLTTFRFPVNFVKSNSFSSGNSKLNLKVSDEAPQKQKQGIDAKDGPGKLIGKSMSFKGLGRSNVGEPKVKMLSPKCTPVQELKVQKQVRDRSSYERKSIAKSDHSFPGPMSVTSSKRPSLGDNVPTSSVNSREYKNTQSDGKLTTFSKHACHSVQKSSDATATTVDLKRPSSTSISGPVFVNGTSSSADVKPSLVSLKEGPALSSSRTADRAVVCANGSKLDVLDNQSEKTSENTSGRSRQGVGAGTLGGNRRGTSSDVFVSRTKETNQSIHEENKLKAAIEAAMQKKQDIYKKNRTPDKPNELLTPNTHGNHVGDAVSNQSRPAICEEAMFDGVATLRTHYSNRQTSLSSAKHFKVYPADFVTSPLGESVLTISQIPEQGSVWQGGFEIRRSGKLPDMCGGFQAHLSSLASCKVIEVVKMFPHKIVLDEVPRPCAWPVQFKESGAREDNIALYFFAKDHESYVRSYKILLEYLMKHDLALRGNVNGIELLVFPSNHLPDKSQCWNALFFMWGVFRGRRQLCPDNESGSVKMRDNSMCNMALLNKDVPLALSPSEDSCQQRPVPEGLSVSGCSYNVVSSCKLRGSVLSTPRHLSSLSNGDCNQKLFVSRTCLSSQTSIKDPPRRPESHSSGSCAKIGSESGTTALENHCCQAPDIVVEHQASMQEVDRGNQLHEAQESPSYLMQDISSLSSKVPVAAEQDSGGSVVSSEEQAFEAVHNNDVTSKVCFRQEHGSAGNIKNLISEVKLKDDVKCEEEEMKSKQKNDRSKLKLEGSLKQQGYVDMNVSADSSTMEEFHSLQFSPKRHSRVDSTESISQAGSVMTSQKRPWIDKKDPLESEDQSSTNKRMKGAEGFCGSDVHRLPSSVSDSFSAQMHGVSTSSPREDTSNEAYGEKSTFANPESAGRYLFLVDSNPGQSTQSGDNSSPWKVSLSENDDRLPDGSPNLELALGVEKKQSSKGVLPFFAGIVDKKDPDLPPDTSRVEDEDGSAALSLSLAFPFSDKERKFETSPTNVERALTGRHEVNTSLLLFRRSSRK